MKIYVDWEMYGILLAKLTSKIKNDGGRYVGVYPVPRGGYPIALYLSHHLKIPIVKKPKPGILIVDDISDTGKTLLSKKHKGMTCACLYTTWWTKKTPDFYVAEKERKGDWVLFPYEVAENE